MGNKIDYRKVMMFDGEGGNAQHEEINYKELFYKYILKKWPFYLLSLAVFLGFAYYKVKSTQPVYEITSKLLIKEKQEDYSAENDWVKKNLNFTIVSENVTNEIEVLSAFSLMNEVIVEMGLDVHYFWKNQWYDKDVYKNFPIKVDTFSLKPIQDADFEFEIIPQDDGKVFLMKQGEVVVGVYPYGEVFTNTFGTFRFIKNENAYHEPDASMHVGFLYAKGVTDSYLSEFAVEFSDVKMKSSILKLTLMDVIPERGEDILKRLIEKYNKKKFRESNELALKTLQFIDDRLGEISKDLASAESSLEQFKLNNNITAETTSDLDILLRDVNELNKEQKGLEVDISIISSMKNKLQEQGDEYELIPVNLSLVNVQIQDLIKPYNDLVLKRKNLLVTGQPNNPIVQSVNQELNSLRGSIFEALNNMENDLALELDVKKNQYDEISQRLRSVPKKERQLTDKSRTQSVTEDLYVYLLKKKEEASLALVNNFSDGNIVDAPRSSIYPVAPNKMLYMFGGLVGGLALPFFLVVGTDFIRDSVLTEKELKAILPGVNIMGMIGRLRGKERHVVLRQRRDAAAEHFRAIRTKLQFHYRLKQKCIMITSSISSEGKTFFSANLAMSYALAKKKTIIIDFDLHKPDLLNYFEDMTNMGLGDFLTNSAEVDDIIQHSKIAPNLDYILSGPLLANPSELLLDEKIDELFSRLKKQYEIIIIDTPPVGIVSDALLLNKQVTNSLYVIRSGVTKIEMLEKAKELFDKELITNPSLVLNGVKKSDIYGYRSKYGSYKKYAI